MIWPSCGHAVGGLLSDLTTSSVILETFEAVEAQIAEFEAVDPGSDAFRSAHDSKGKLIN
jgi:hypothetical protein